MKQYRHKYYLGVMLLCAAFALSACTAWLQTPDAGEDASEQSAPEEAGEQGPSSSLPPQSSQSQPQTDPVPEPIPVHPRVYDRFVLNEDGKVFVYLPDYAHGGTMTPDLLIEGDAVVYLQPVYTAEMSVYQEISAQFHHGSIYSYSGWHYKMHGGMHGPTTQSVGYDLGEGRGSEKDLRWYDAGHCLTPEGVLQTYDYTDGFTPIAESVQKASLGVLPDRQFYLLYLTEEGALHFYAQTEQGVLHEPVTEGVWDFDLSGLSYRSDPDVLFLQTEDGALSYGRYWDHTDSEPMDLQQLLNQLRDVAAAPEHRYPQRIRWFQVTDRTCTVLGKDGALAYCEYPLVFQAIEAETGGLTSANVFFQNHSYTQELSAHLLAMYADGGILCKEVPLITPVEERSIPQFVRLVDGNIGVTADGELFEIAVAYNDPRNITATKIDGLFDRARIYMGSTTYSPLSLTSYKLAGQPWEVVYRHIDEELRLPLVLPEEFEALGAHLLLDGGGTLYRLKVAELIQDSYQLREGVTQLDLSHFAPVAQDAVLAQDVSGDILYLDGDGTLWCRGGVGEADRALAQDVVFFTAGNNMHFLEPQIIYQTASGTIHFLIVDEQQREPVEIGSSDRRLFAAGTSVWLVEEDGAVYEASLVNQKLEKMCWPTGRSWVDSGWSGNFRVLLDDQGEVLVVENISVSGVERRDEGTA